MYGPTTQSNSKTLSNEVWGRATKLLYMVVNSCTVRRPAVFLKLKLVPVPVSDI